MTYSLSDSLESLLSAAAKSFLICALVEVFFTFLAHFGQLFAQLLVLELKLGKHVDRLVVAALGVIQASLHEARALVGRRDILVPETTVHSVVRLLVLGDLLGAALAEAGNPGFLPGVGS